MYGMQQRVGSPTYTTLPDCSHEQGFAISIVRGCCQIHPRIHSLFLQNNDIVHS